MSHRASAPIALAILTIIALTATLASAAQPAQSPQAQVFLPQLIQTGQAPNPPMFGIEMSSLTAERGIDLAITTGTTWVRRGALHWKRIEPVEDGGYVWDDPWTQALERDMITASQNGLRLVITVYASPRWATAPYQADCAPINPAKYEQYARFMAAVVQRYSVPPYNVKYWEIGNEPDAPIFAEDNVFGCWGDQDDPYFGGRAFGEMLKVVVPAIKAADPDTRVLNGGLLLAQAYEPARSETLPGRFFEGVLETGAGRLIDIVSFHTYTYHRSPGQPDLGPREDWRIKYLRDLLARYGLEKLPLIRTESALLCYGEHTPECRWAQADMVGRTFARSARDGLLANIWYVYDNDSYHNTALIEPNDVWVPRPAYFAFRHAARLLNSAQYVGPIPDLPAAAEGYVFTRGRDTIYIYWSDEPSGVAFSLPVPAGASVACTNRDGGPEPCAPADGALSLTAQVSPAFARVGP